MTTPDQPGWYDDPHDSNAQRYWDGQDWTPHRQRKPISQRVQRPAAPVAPRQPPPPPPNLPPPRLSPTPAAAPTQAAPVPTLPPPPPGDSAAPAAQGTGVPSAPPPPQAWPPPDPQTRGASGQMASDGLATVKGFAAKLPITAWLLVGGFVLAAIALFLPWVTVGADIPLAGHFSEDLSLFKGVWRVAALLVIAVAAALSWPAFTGSQMPVNQLIGLTVVTGLFIVALVIGFYRYTTGVSDVDKEFAGRHMEDYKNLVDVSIGSGLMLYTAAVVAVVAGVVGLWRNRSQIQKQAS